MCGLRPRAIASEPGDDEVAWITDQTAQRTGGSATCEPDPSGDLAWCPDLGVFYRAENGFGITITAEAALDDPAVLADLDLRDVLAITSAAVVSKLSSRRSPATQAAHAIVSLAVVRRRVSAAGEGGAAAIGG